MSASARRNAAFKRAEAALREAEARQAYAQTQARRYEQLFAVRSISEEIVTTKRQELQIADAALSAAREDLARARSDREALVAQRSNLRLIAPVDGVVAVRDADPGTTIVAGQAVVEVIDPEEPVDQCALRPDQRIGTGRRAARAHRAAFAQRPDAVRPRAARGTHGRRGDRGNAGQSGLRYQPEPLPPVGELAEVTVDLPTLPAAPVIPNAAVRRDGDKIGVWQIVDGRSALHAGQARCYRSRWHCAGARRAQATAIRWWSIAKRR